VSENSWGERSTWGNRTQAILPTKRKSSKWENAAKALLVC
jgi:hypothetical protein